MHHPEVVCQSLSNHIETGHRVKFASDHLARFSSNSSAVKGREPLRNAVSNLRGSPPNDQEYSLPPNSFSEKAWKSGLTASQVSSRLGAKSRSLTQISIS